MRADRSDKSGMGTDTDSTRASLADTGGRRRLLQALGTGSAVATTAAAVPSAWTRPLVESLVIPAHAATTIDGKPERLGTGIGFGFGGGQITMLDDELLNSPEGLFAHGKSTKSSLSGSAALAALVSTADANGSSGPCTVESVELYISEFPESGDDHFLQIKSTLDCVGCISKLETLAEGLLSPSTVKGEKKAEKKGAKGTKSDAILEFERTDNGASTWSNNLVFAGGCDADALDEL